MKKPVKSFKAILGCIEDESDLRDIHQTESEQLYDQNEAEAYIFMNPVKRERLERCWTQGELAHRINVKQTTIAKWEREGAVYHKSLREKLAAVFGISQTSFS
jgi:ribosome-binding protein aMBF1 (putative translation factor)